MKKYSCDCGGKIVKSRCLKENFLVDCLRCNKCDELLFTGDQMREILQLRELNKIIEGKRKIIKVGSSIAALLPKKISVYGVKAGLIDNVRLLSKNSIEIQFSKELIK
ncbi:hypothetical protein COV11_03860 [Candidatus Woesearchaeota archaeon CG10_big_fil_rev_8_21_14_0_10_30_7]|nr:MAG: hypothetical protein COV11_03860 [Candidatus Woesearchaeota archaeon CG10_big_fil_rev_8_21_14_0_10_30_7]